MQLSISIVPEGDSLGRLKGDAPTSNDRCCVENCTLFESYFSNFIEGTEFEVGEAYDIIYEGVIPRERPDDAHDIDSCISSGVI